MNLILYIEKILDKLQSILHTLAGWVVGLLLFLGDFIGGHELAVGLVVFVAAIANAILTAIGYERVEKTYSLQEVTIGGVTGTMWVEVE